jgi:DinB superfamily
MWSEGIPAVHLVAGLAESPGCLAHPRAAGLTAVAGQCGRGRAPDGRLSVLTRNRPPPPVTTIAWRLWHIGSECLADYRSRGLGPWPLEVRGREWYPSPDLALGALDRAWQAFYAGLVRLGEHGLWRPLGPAWEEFADDLWAQLVLHAQDELSHHGAEVALLRDLYLRINPAGQLSAS